MNPGGVRLFRYRGLSDPGRLHKGELTPDRLRLNACTLPLLAIASAAVEGDVLHLDVSGPGGLLRMSLRVEEAGELKSVIDYAIRTWESSHPGLARTERFRIQPCARCGDFINLSGFPVSPAVYCRDCDIVFSREPGGPPEELTYTVCPICGYYSRISPFRSFFLVFFCLPGLGFLGTSSVDAPTVRCHPCMRKDAWRMVLVNLIGCVAVPYGLVQLVRAYFLGTGRSRAFRELDAANIAARKGQAEAADALYRTLLERGTSSAGIWVNRGQARLAAGDAAGALDRARDALRVCANYERALELAGLSLRSLGRGDEADAMARGWPRPGLDLTADPSPDSP